MLYVKSTDGNPDSTLPSSPSDDPSPLMEDVQSDGMCTETPTIAYSKFNAHIDTGKHCSLFNKQYYLYFSHRCKSIWNITEAPQTTYSS